MMKFNKSDILLALETITIAGEGENMVASGAVTNVMTFADEVVVDITMATPALHIKKRAEADIIKTIQEKVSLEAKVQVNITIQAPAKPSNPNLIKGKPIAGIKNIIAIASGKGGVGKSTVTANLAITLSKMGFKVGVLDADIYGPSIPIMFDLANERPLSVNVDGKSKMKPVENYGVKVLSIGFFTKQTRPLYGEVLWLLRP